ncbi:MAG TPA: hypothetical protein DDX84_12645 [Nitrospiraceae bacterium]|nr:MAG: hypothetical protein A3D21_03985 [Nitrospirae bacterium RIFCSPHIGHO2_02_FULL_42_12]HBI25015.1 hypothetical protein [Nitrospiraceae bacterium]
MQDFVKSYIDKIEAFAKSKKESIGLLVVGGLAMDFYGIPRYTIDIDAEIKCSNKIYFELIEYLRKENISFNIGENISRWGIIPLPTNYMERAKNVYQSEYLTILILDPVDFVYSKLLRGTEEDFNDAAAVIRKYNITKDSLIERERLVQFPKDTETLFFKKKLQHLLELID